MDRAPTASNDDKNAQGEDGGNTKLLLELHL